MDIDYKPLARKSLRLKDFDYSNTGVYFITFCTNSRYNYFGDIKKGELYLNDFGNLASHMWKGLIKVFSNIVLEEYVIMPNHIHGIIAIISEKAVGNASERKLDYFNMIQNSKNKSNIKLNVEMRSLQNNMDRTKMLIPKIIQIYKSELTKRYKRLTGNLTSKSIWQRSYYDRIIRNERELNNIRDYIYYNPLKWEFDIEKESNSGKQSRDEYYDKIFNNN